MWAFFKKKKSLVSFAQQQDTSMFSIVSSPSAYICHSIVALSLLEHLLLSNFIFHFEHSGECVVVSHLVLIPISLLTNEVSPVSYVFWPFFSNLLTFCFILSAFFLPICMSTLYILHMNSVCTSMCDKALSSSCIIYSCLKSFTF